MHVLLLIVAFLGFAPPTVHSVSDISQEFTFYMDGRFHRQYLKDVGRDVRNWGSIARLNLTNANLLILTRGNHRIPYSKESLETVLSFVEGGGTLLLMADGAAPAPPASSIARSFRAELTNTRATKPLRGVNRLAGEEITFRNGRILKLGPEWSPLLLDKNDEPVLAMREYGDGHVLLGSRGLFGSRPDASDPINAAWVTPLLVDLASSKAIDPKKPHRRTWVEHKKEVGPLSLEYHDGTAQFIDGIVKEYQAARPHLEAITGCDPSPGMIKRLLILPTGGGGFSSGVLIAIGAWWGNYPEHRYPMVELIAHEAGHSWVLPYAEPLWNEPIATYLGIQVGRRMGMPKAEETLKRAIAHARRYDPELDSVDPLSDDAHRNLVWGKSYFVFEELERLHGPGAMAKYFKMKRKVLEPGRKGYSMDDCVAVWSLAVGEDLFPWFRSLAFNVDRLRTDLPAP